MSDASGRTKSIGSKAGLGRVDPPQGTFVIFAAGVGQQAIDTLGGNDTNPNGLFTRELLKTMDQPNVEIRSMVQQLRTKVRKLAVDAGAVDQTPSYYDQLLGEFYFRATEDPSSQKQVATLPIPQVTLSPETEKFVRISEVILRGAKTDEKSSMREVPRIITIRLKDGTATLEVIAEPEVEKKDLNAYTYRLDDQKNEAMDVPSNAKLYTPGYGNTVNSVKLQASFKAGILSLERWEDWDYYEKDKVSIGTADIQIYERYVVEIDNASCSLLDRFNEYNSHHSFKYKKEKTTWQDDNTVELLRSSECTVLN